MLAMKTKKQIKKTGMASRLAKAHFSGDLVAIIGSLVPMVVYEAGRVLSPCQWHSARRRTAPF
jgi:hypothetical protein